MSKATKARELYSQGAKIEEISKIMNESPFLVAQWVKKKKAKNEL